MYETLLQQKPELNPFTTSHIDIFNNFKTTFLFANMLYRTQKQNTIWHFLICKNS